MKITAILALPLVISVCAAQAPQPAKPGARNDVYHVHFAKAALGKTAQLGDYLKSQNQKAAMPGHYLVLRHQSGDAWDFAVIEHLGAKVTLDAAGTAPAPAVRDSYDWHTDTFVSGPPWEDFAHAMGIEGQAGAKSAGAVYVLSTYRAAPGHREQLEKMLSESRLAAAAAGQVLMQHLEGGPWQYLSLDRYNSWQDFATSENDSVARTMKGSGDWFEMRNHAASHTDTVSTRIAP
jgi:hypothetical protein